MPHTLSDDGNPIDACVLTPMPIVHGCNSGPSDWRSDDGR